MIRVSDRLNIDNLYINDGDIVGIIGKMAPGKVHFVNYFLE